ncbi:hypothetical protein [Exiguobacterium sp. KRL4]|uniref:hypothetical protein n=1 Tax=Exiguobacterium sp. KRL4 TaxID=1914536 RepID=UPI00191BBAA1|nr:hypothetical protein [Exiguobacterium sp. KRL4]
MVKTIIPLAGSVGGFGDEATRGAIGHGVHNALSPFPSMHQILHGGKVGYGLLIQELLLGQAESYVELQHYLVTNQQPTTSTEFGLTEDEREKLAKRIGQETLCLPVRFWQP